MKLDMNALMKQAQQMQEQMVRAQEEAKTEIAEASAGGGMVKVKANGAGELVEISDRLRAPSIPTIPSSSRTWCSRLRTRRSAPPRRRSRRSSAGQMPDLGALGLPGM